MIENTYTVSVIANNIVGSSEKTIVDYSKLIYIFQIIIRVLLSLLDVRWLQNVNSKNVDITHLQAEVVFTTAVCVEQDDLNILIVYNNNTANIIATATKSYVANTTDSFILSSLQPSATIYYTLQVIDTNSNTIGSTNTGSFVFTSSSSSPMPSSSPTPSSVMPTTTTTTTTTTIPAGMRVFILLYLLHIVSI